MAELRRSSVTWLRAAVLLGCFYFCWHATAQNQPDVVLHATIQGKGNQSYLELPFEVPHGITRITVVFSYTGKEERTTLDLGIADPERFRGWSGGNKDTFTLASSDATPSYLPGAIAAGRWKLLVGVPNIRPESTSSLEAKIYFSRESSEVSGFGAPAFHSGPKWYRGDLHMHTGHSDGRCRSQSGKEIPCPVFVTLQAAVRRGLDFVAITDHNTNSQSNTLRELQPYFDRLLLLPGREITTFQGHANLFGIQDFVDFRIGSQSVPEMTDFLEKARAMGALVSINHPSVPSGESCMGCGWQLNTAMEIQLVSAVEVINGGVPEGPYSGLNFWEQQLHEGHRLTAIGGSDNHQPELSLEKAGSVGSPTTVVYALDFSVQAILDAIRAGHVFIDLTGSHERLLEFSAAADKNSAVAGDVLRVASGAEVEITAHIAGCQGSSAIFYLDGHSTTTISPQEIHENDATIRLRWKSDGKQHWLRAEVRSMEDKLQLLGNPIYINY